MPITVVKKGQVDTEVQTKTGAVIQESKALPEAVFEGKPAELTVDLSYTMNLGNYESTRLRVALTLPVQNDKESLEAQFGFVKDYVDVKLNSLIEEVKKGLKHEG